MSQSDGDCVTLTTMNQVHLQVQSELQLQQTQHSQHSQLDHVTLLLMVMAVML